MPKRGEGSIRAPTVMLGIRGFGFLKIMGSIGLCGSHSLSLTEWDS